MNALWPWKVAVVFNTGAELLQSTDTRFVLCHPGKSLLLLGSVDLCCAFLQQSVCNLDKANA